MDRSGVRTSFALYNKIAALYPSKHRPCTVGGLWDFSGRAPDEIAADLLVWASDSRMEEDWGMCRLIASLTASTDQLDCTCDPIRRWLTSLITVSLMTCVWGSWTLMRARPVVTRQS